jgi:hypothetical protein
MKVSLFLVLRRNIFKQLTSFPLVDEDDTDDEDYNEASEADISLESFDHIDEDELEDIEQDNTMPTPKTARKKTVPAPTARKKSPMKDLEEIEEMLEREDADGTSFTILLPKMKCEVQGGAQGCCGVRTPLFAPP